MNQTTIVLSKEALDALFPVGTEARIQFATSAVKAFCEREIKPSMISADVARMVDHQRRVAVDEVVKKLGAIETHRGIAFTDGFKDRLRATAQSVVDDLITDMANAAAKTAVETYGERLLASLNERMRFEANKAVREAVGQAVATVLTVAPKA